ncbi:MAG: glycoside hydrolase family 20 zincin-like fold domain-containing protein [Kiritimatiellales bacterium]
MILIPEPKSIRFNEGTCLHPEQAPFVVCDATLGAEAYRLSISSAGVHIAHGGPAGLFYARQTLAQIVGQCGERMPCLEIEDAPALPERGFMLDISRCKVPTLESLMDIVRLMASLKMNQFQLYMEHTFAYTGHETVWKDASPLTAEELRALDAHCRDLHIELVPNQNSFGHMERWLRHEDYRHLAECPDGFVHPVDGKRRPCGTTLRPDQASLDFVGGLFDQLLPNFTSRKFNIGGDEPWELGTGWSQPLAESMGKGRLYLNHLSKLVALATAHGREALYWADGLLHSPELVPLAPDNARPVIWGYEADHPFDEQCALIAATGKPFYLAPGDSTWNSFTGRLHIARANIRAAARAAVRYGATGFLHTHWGDNGHPQTWVTALPGLLLAANSSWNPHSDEPALADSLDILCFKDSSMDLGKAAVTLGGLDEAIGIPIPNRSFLFLGANQPPEELAPYLPQLTDQKLEAGRQCLDSAREHIERAAPQTDEGLRCREELQLAHDMALYALERVRRIRDNASLDALQTVRMEISERFADIWLTRNRPGGLDESLDKNSLSRS